MSLSALEVPVDLDELVTTSPVECVRSLETGKLKKLLQWIVERLQFHDEETSTFNKRLEELETWKSTDPLTQVQLDIAELKEYKVQCSEELGTHGQTLLELKSSIEDLKISNESYSRPEDTDQTHSDMDLAKTEEQETIHTGNNVQQDDLQSEGSKDEKDGAVQRRVQDIEEKIRETKEQSEHVDETNYEIDEDTQRLMTGDTLTEMKGPLMNQIVLKEGHDLERAVQKLAERLEKAEWQLKEIEEQIKEQPALNKDSQTCNDLLTKDPEIFTISSVPDFHSHKKVAESSTEIEKVSHQTDAIDYSQKDPAIFEEEHVQTLNTDSQAETPTTLVNSTSDKFSERQQNALEDLKNQILKLESDFGAFQHNANAAVILQRLDALENAQEEKANTEHKLHKNNPLDDKYKLPSATVGGIMETNDSKKATEEELRKSIISDADNIGFVYQEENAKVVPTDFQDLLFRLNDIQHNKADNVAVESLNAKLEQSINQILEKVSKGEDLMSTGVDKVKPNEIAINPSKVNSSSTELKAQVENLQESFANLLQNIKQNDPKVIENLQKKVKKLSVSIQKMKQQTQDKSPAVGMMPFGDHAMLSAKPILGYKCMACDRPLEKIDAEQGPFVPRNILPATKPKSHTEIIYQDSEIAQQDFSQVHFIRTPRDAVKVLGSEDANLGPTLPKGGWKTHGNYRAKLRSRHRSRHGTASTRAPESRTA